MLAAYTEHNDPWTCLESRESAEFLLSRYATALDQDPAQLAPKVLRETVRPVFSKQKPAALAPSGRAAVHVPEVEAPMFQTSEMEEKPWKFRSPWIVCVFVWCTEHVNVSLRVHALSPYGSRTCHMIAHLRS